MKDNASKQEANALSLSEQIDIYTEGTAALYTGPSGMPTLTLPWIPRVCPTCGRPMDEGPFAGSFGGIRAYFNYD